MAEKLEAKAVDVMETGDEAMERVEGDGGPVADKDGDDHAPESDDVVPDVKKEGGLVAQGDSDPEACFGGGQGMDVGGVWGGHGGGEMGGDAWRNVYVNHYHKKGFSVKLTAGQVLRIVHNSTSFNYNRELVAWGMACVLT